MDVILNTESLSPPLTGIGNYTLHLLRGLLERPDIDRVYRFAGPRRLPENDDPPQTSAAAKALRKFKNQVRGLPGAYPLRTWFRDLRFKQLFRQHSQAVYHEPNYILKPYSGPSVATLHDTSHLLYPHFHPRERVAYLGRALPATIARASQLITLSEFMRGELMRHFSIVPEKISTIHLGVDPCYRPYGQGEARTTLQKYGLIHGRYLLSVATLEPRKNLVGLLRAYRQLGPALRAHYPLVLAGAPGWHSSPLQAELRSLGDSVRLLGYLPARDLPHLYAGASGFALVSFFEGFGLPALEAMASGIPLLCSQRSALPEVAGDAALYVEPEDIEAMAKQLTRLLEDQGLRSALASAGLARASKFSWRDCVERTVEVYRRAVTG